MVAYSHTDTLQVEPEEGLSKVDKEFYLLQSEFYTEDLKRDSKSRKLESSYTRGLAEDPNYVVFNGRMGAHVAEEVCFPACQFFFCFNVIHIDMDM